MQPIDRFASSRQMPIPPTGFEVPNAQFPPPPLPTPTPERYDHWLRTLARIREYFAPQLQRDNGVICIKKQRDEERSLGVNRLLVNYHLPSPEAQARIVAATADPGKQRSLEAFRHTVNEATVRANNMRRISTNAYQYYEEAINAVTEFSKVGLLPLGEPEFKLGSRNIIARESPTSTVWAFVVGAIDMFLYNRVTGKLVVVEAKSSRPSESGESNVRFLSMEQLYFKEKHCMQLTLYAVLLILMSVEAQVPISPNDIELVLFANNKIKRTSVIWAFDYNPQTFLGKHWAPDRWYGLLDTGCFQVLNQPPLVAAPAQPPTPAKPKCSVCGTTEGKLGHTRTKPIQVICTHCYDVRRCACGRLLRVASRKYCDSECPKLKSGIVKSQLHPAPGFASSPHLHKT